MVALDPLWPERATVGGIVATNDSGPLRLQYGSLRDLIIGMTIVLADGTIAKTGGKVVKNVAGYDLHKLMTGSFGTLGVITEVNFRLHPAEQYARTLTDRPDADHLPSRFCDLTMRKSPPLRFNFASANANARCDVRFVHRPDAAATTGGRRRISGEHSIAEARSSVEARQHDSSQADCGDCDRGSDDLQRAREALRRCA